jgi:hypothetical protein
MAINKEWHLANKMPPKATTEQRIEWHLEHQKHCSCAPIPKKLLAEMDKRNIQIAEIEVKNE